MNKVNSYDLFITFDLFFLFSVVILALLSTIFLAIYIKLGIRFKIVSIPNFRTLHEDEKIRGGGIAFAPILCLFIALFWFFNRIDFELFMMFSFGGAAACIFGFLDDLYDIKASTKLFVQCLLAVWLCFWLDQALGIGILWLLLSLFFVVWAINAFNFMDGVDGLAVSGSIFFSVSSGIVIVVSGKIDSSIMIILIALATCLLPILVANWPPSKVFMGDSGSIFLGYIFSGIIAYTYFKGLISIWTWITLLGYFFSDTTVTQILRPIIVKEWYKPHRSHSYQNLARIYNSHLKVTGTVLALNVIWFLPLALLTNFFQNVAPIICLISVLPALIISIKYGPLFSSD